MRSAIIAAAFAAGALAVPHQKRAVVTKVDLDFVTQLVTVTAGQAVATSAAAAALTTVAAAAHFGHHDHIQPIAKPAPQVSSSVVVEAVVVQPSAAPVAAPASHTLDIVQPQQQAQSSSGGSSSNAPSSDSINNIAAPILSLGGSYQNMVINSHNIHRANHSAPNIEWDDDLAATAQKIGQTCDFKHQMDTNGGGYGQNIACGVVPENVDQVVTNMWYNGEASWFEALGLYGKASPPTNNLNHWGHFSQMVWIGSTKVGCATVDCSASGLQNGAGLPFFTVCNYGSRGNVAPLYADNIKEPKGFAPVYAS